MRKATGLFVVACLLAAVATAQDVPAPLAAAVRQFAKAPGAPGPTFDHALVDLNGDGVADAVVLITDREWCGSGGCTMLVFRAAGNGFALVSRSTITREPIRLSPETAHGWRTLIASSNGVGEVLMRFDGNGYPLNPSVQPKASRNQIAAARLLIGGAK